MSCIVKLSVVRDKKTVLLLSRGNKKAALEFGAAGEAGDTDKSGREKDEIKEFATKSQIRSLTTLVYVRFGWKERKKELWDFRRNRK